VRRIAGAADEVVCLLTPEAFGSIGAFYLNFSQLSDEDVRYLLEDARRRQEEYRLRAVAPPR
jgi:putative phosphoribosyl transferase